MREKKWLYDVLMKKNLTSKDKLTATYLLFVREENGVKICNDETVCDISKKSRLAERTIQKSIARLSFVGFIRFVEKNCFVLRCSDER